MPRKSEIVKNFGRKNDTRDIRVLKLERTHDKKSKALTRAANLVLKSSP